MMSDETTGSCGHAEDAAIAFALGFLDKHAVHLVHRRRSGCESDDVCERPDRNWSPDGDAIEPAAILR